ncbi:hypothetical protein [Shewanella subflava]|uniref:Uncharacterized protein n=1 Tax=Shewanella subflava TaxID=2986476 RepID=A0ABT3IB60_9GAMM|nr:hypothetical protein [Shewanella subflava]MCW3173286.1 hypothetical protein [Shewanella subflava]
MSISNAKRWNELCELQIITMNNLANQFPERREHLSTISNGWRHMQQQLLQNKVPSLK